MITFKIFKQNLFAIAYLYYGWIVIQLIYWYINRKNHMRRGTREAKQHSRTTLVQSQDALSWVLYTGVGGWTTGKIKQITQFTLLLKIWYSIGYINFTPWISMKSFWTHFFAYKRAFQGVKHVYLLQPARTNLPVYLGRTLWGSLSNLLLKGWTVFFGGIYAAQNRFAVL